MLIIPAPSYSLRQAPWISCLTIWRDDGTTERPEGEPGESWAAVMSASWRLGQGPRRLNRPLTQRSSANQDQEPRQHDHYPLRQCGDLIHPRRWRWRSLDNG